MEVIKALAKDVYRYGGLPKGVEFEQEIPVEVKFELNDLTPERGYVITPVDGLFRRTAERLGTTTKSIELRLPRSGDLHSTIFPQPLRFWAGMGDWYDEKVSIPSIKYFRDFPFEEFREEIILGGRYCFDCIDTGKINLENFLKESVMSEPIDESVKIYLKNAELSLYVGGNYRSQRLELEIFPLGDLNKKLKDLGIRLSTPTIDLKGKKAEECVAITEQVLDYFINRN